ncbi:MAG: ECF-type sigma factor [Acidobacteriota bacterium]
MDREPGPDPSPADDTASLGTDELLPLLYQELRQLAGSMMARERAALTLQPTALVHEAYLRLGGAAGRWDSRAHFYGSAAIAMRRILVERARAAARDKRGGALRRVTLTDGGAMWDVSPEEMLALDAALDALARRDSTMARIVELRFVVGLTVAEVAEVLDVSSRTVNRSWTAARAWLYDHLRRGDGGESGGAAVGGPPALG